MSQNNVCNEFWFGQKKGIPICTVYIVVIRTPRFQPIPQEALLCFYAPAGLEWTITPCRAGMDDHALPGWNGRSRPAGLEWTITPCRAGMDDHALPGWNGRSRPAGLE